MIIVKLTALSILVTIALYFATKIWVSVDPKRAFKASFEKKYPKLLYVYILSVFLSVVGVFASAIYLLFLR